MKKYVLGIAFLAGLLSFMACNEIDILSPPGPEGPEGKSAYQVWKDAVNDGIIEWNLGIDEANYFKYLKGEAGETGENAYETWKKYISTEKVDDPHNPGETWDPKNNSMADFYKFLTGAKGDDGLTPSINDDGYWVIGTDVTTVRAAGSTVTIVDGFWYIDGVNTDFPAAGKDGSIVTIGADGYWYIDGENTTVPAAGKDGDTVSIENGYWYINGEPTTIKAEGDKGDKGDPGDPGDKITIVDGYWYINDEPTQARVRDEVTIENGYWYINGEPTNVPAQGIQGIPGVEGPEGASAFVIWQAELAKVPSTIKDRDGEDWPKTANSLQQFWYYLQGKYSDGTEAVVQEKERTPLTFLSSERADTLQKFTFRTDRGAKVTMNHEKITVEGTTDATGICVIDFPNSATREFYAVVYAEASDKLLSYPMNVRVPIRASSYDLELDYPGMVWINGSGYGEDVIDDEGFEVAYIYMYGSSDMYIDIPFTTINIMRVYIEQTSGFGQFDVAVIPDTQEDYSRGILRIKPINLDLPPIGEQFTDIVVTAVTNQYIPVATIRMRVFYER